jgi:cell division septum initiation protein DivIVA
VDVNDKIDELSAMVAGARSMPMSSSCVVNRAEVLEALDALRRALPADLARADSLLDDADGVRAAAHRDADAIVASAHDEKMRLVSETEVVAQAHREAGRILAAAETEAASMRQEIDDYIDAKLANFEIVLSKTMEAVHRGREKIQGRRAVEDLGPALPELDEDVAASS